MIKEYNYNRGEKNMIEYGQVSPNFSSRASGSPYTLAYLTSGWQKKMGEETNQFLLPLHLPSHLEY